MWDKVDQSPDYYACSNVVRLNVWLDTSFLKAGDSY